MDVVKQINITDLSTLFFAVYPERFLWWWDLISPPPVMCRSVANLSFRVLNQLFGSLRCTCSFCPTMSGFHSGFLFLFRVSVHRSHFFLHFLSFFSFLVCISTCISLSLSSRKVSCFVCAFVFLWHTLKPHTEYKVQLEKSEKTVLVFWSSFLNPKIHFGVLNEEREVYRLAYEKKQKEMMEQFRSELLKVENIEQESTTYCLQ